MKLIKQAQFGLCIKILLSRIFIYLHPPLQLRKRIWRKQNILNFNTIKLIFFSSINLLISAKHMEAELKSLFSSIQVTGIRIPIISPNGEDFETNKINKKDNDFKQQFLKKQRIFRELCRKRLPTRWNVWRSKAGIRIEERVKWNRAKPLRSSRRKQMEDLCASRAW